MTIKVTPSFQGTCVVANHLNIPYNCAVIVMLSIANYSNFFKRMINCVKCSNYSLQKSVSIFLMHGFDYEYILMYLHQFFLQQSIAYLVALFDRNYL